MEGYVWMWFEGDEEDLRAVEVIFGPQPFVRRVLRPDGSAVLRGKARLWRVGTDDEETSGGMSDVEDEILEAVAARLWGDGEVGLARRCRELGLDLSRAVELYHLLAAMTDEEVMDWARQALKRETPTGEQAGRPQSRGGV